MHDVVPTIEAWRSAGQPVALATVVATWGSAPRQPGARMGVATTMQMTGSVSGGCVETAVVSAALDALADQTPRLLDFGVADDTAWEVGLACGGQVSVYVEPLDTGWWEIAAAHTQRERALATALVLSGPQAGAKVAASAEGSVYVTPGLAEETHAALAAAAQEALAAPPPRRTTVGALDVFVEVYQPRPRLFLVGGAHVALALSSLAATLGFRVLLIDPRAAFATPERFPNVAHISHDYPQAAFAALELDSNSYVAVLTHDPKIDDPALWAALPSPARYVGVLSSRRTHQRRVARLTAAGMDSAWLERVHTPIGLAIGARTPEEIALAILAEIIAVRNGVQP